MTDFAAISHKFGVEASQLVFGVGLMAEAIRGAMEKEQQEVRKKALLPQWELPPDLVLAAIDGGFIRDMMRVVYEKAGMPDRWITDKEIAEWRAEAIRRINGGQRRQEEAYRIVYGQQGRPYAEGRRYEGVEARSAAGGPQTEGTDEDRGAAAS